MNRNNAFCHLLTALIVIGACCEAGVLVYQRPVRLGDSLSLVCRQTGQQRKYVKWNKAVNVDNQTINVERIGDDRQLESLYRDTGRYSSEYTEEGAGASLTRNYVLKINNITVEDSGHVACSIDEVNETYQVFTVEPYILPSDISVNGAANGSTIYFREGVATPLNCTASSMMPSQGPRVTIADVDSTSLFTRLETKQVRCSNVGAAGKNCLLHFLYDLDLSNGSFRMPYTANGRLLTCEVRYDVDGMMRSVSNRIDVKFSPKFECLLNQYAMLDDKKANVSCTIIGNPPITEYYWEVRNSEGRIEQINSSKTLSPTSEFRAFDQQTNMYSKEVQLTIVGPIYRRHFTSYKLVSRNARGLNITNVRLVEGKQVSGSERFGVSFSLLALFSAFIINLYTR